MRKISRLTASILVTATCLLPACARSGSGISPAGPGAGISTADALTQAQGAATALATLAQTSPMDSATKSQMGNWSAWATFALQAAGIMVPMAEAVAGS